MRQKPKQNIKKKKKTILVDMKLRAADLALRHSECYKYKASQVCACFSWGLESGYTIKSGKCKAMNNEDCRKMHNVYWWSLKRWCFLISLASMKVYINKLPYIFFNIWLSYTAGSHFVLNQSSEPTQSVHWELVSEQSRHGWTDYNDYVIKIRGILKFHIRSFRNSCAWRRQEA